jgi:hypothetical protein
MGWREWLALPELQIPAIKAKVDTGARSSALHAFDLHRFTRDGQAMVQFKVHPQQRSTAHTVAVEAAVWDERMVRSSNGQAHPRPVIRTPVQLAGQQWWIDLTLTNRDAMGFRMLLGREAVRQRFWVDPGGSYLLQPPPTALEGDDEMDDTGLA